MTNEEFKKMTEYALESKNSPVRWYYEHIRKLIVVVEAAKQFIEDDVPDNPASTGDLRRALEQLE